MVGTLPDGGKLRPGAFFSGGHQLDLLELGSLNSKKYRHLDNLARTHEIAWAGAKIIQAWVKLTATHLLRQVKAKPAFTILLVLQTEFTNYHLCISFRDPESFMQSLSAHALS
jgi:hypothetical protein